MRILLTSEKFLPGLSGVVTSVRLLGEELARREVVVGLVCPGSIDARMWADAHGVTLFDWPAWSAPAVGRHLPRPFGGYRAAHAVAQFEPTAVHAHAPLIVGRAVLQAARRAGVPTVATAHVIPGNFAAALRVPKGLQRVAAATFARWVDHGHAHAGVRVFPTKAAIAQVGRSVGQAQSRVVLSNGVEVERWSAATRHPSPSTPLRVLYVGRLQRSKRVADVIDGIAALRREGVLVHLTVVGSGPEERRLRRRAGAGVTFLGPVDDASLEAAYCDADVFCMPSPGELQCLAALEAMAAGLPVVGAAAGALPETVDIGGLLYPPGDAHALSQTLGDLARSVARRAELAAAARQVAARHNLTVTTDQFVALYAGLASPTVGCSAP